MEITPTNNTKEILLAYKENSKKLFKIDKMYDTQVRGIGLFVDNLKKSDTVQFDIFKEDLNKLTDLDYAIDKVRNMGEFDLIQYADSMHFVKGRTHFVDRS